MRSNQRLVLGCYKSRETCEWIQCAKKQPFRKMVQKIRYTASCAGKKPSSTTAYYQVLVTMPRMPRLSSSRPGPTSLACAARSPATLTHTALPQTLPPCPPTWSKSSRSGVGRRSQSRPARHGRLLCSDSLPLGRGSVLLAAGAGTSGADGQALLARLVTCRRTPMSVSGSGGLKLAPCRNSYKHETSAKV